MTATPTTPPTTPPGSGAGSTAPASTVPPTTAPGRPTAADLDLLRPLQAAELAVEALYRAARSAGSEEPVFVTLEESHQAYADVLAGVLGGSEEPDTALYDEWLPDFESSDVASVSAAAYELESALVVTHAEVIGQLESVEGATTLASILIVESRHCAVLADLSGNGDDLAALLDNGASPLDVAAGV